MATMNHKSPSSRYPAVGDNYMKRQKQYGTGEWEGYIYDPWIDKYRPDPKKQQDYYEQQGLVDKQEKPGLFEQLYPTVASVGAYEIGKAAGPDIYGAGKGLLGLGEAGTATTTAAETGAATAGTTSATTAGATTAGEAAAIDAGATTAGTGAGTTGGGSATGSGSLSSVALPAAALLTAAYIGNRAYEGYKTGEGQSVGDATKDTGASKEAGITYALNPYAYLASIGGGLAGSVFGSKKDEDQKKRDAVRRAFKDAGFVDQDFNVSLAGGKKFNIGADGSQNLYNVDLSTPEAERDLKLVAPLAQILTGGDKKLGSDFSGYFTNAIRSDGDVLANAKEMYGKAGITSWDQARAALNELRTAGKLTDQEVAVYDQGLANIFGDKGLEAPLAQLSTAPAVIPVQTPAASGLTGLMALGRPAEGTPEPVATPIARPVAGVPVAASPFGGLMALGRPANPEEQMMVVPVARGGYR